MTGSEGLVCMNNIHFDPVNNLVSACRRSDTFNLFLLIRHVANSIIRLNVPDF